MRSLNILIVGVLLISACSTTNGRKGLGPRPGTPEYEARANSPETKTPPPCSTWLNRTRAGGTVGSVVGFIAASAIGTPALGLVYTAAGYAAGAASADKCKKQNEAAAKAAGKSPAAPPVTAKIVEEELE
jgi:hypothetical protein